MNVLCPDCHSSVPMTANEPWLRCPSCGLTADLSRLETSPGAASLSLVRDLAGETLGDYRLEALVGVGGMGVVYRGKRPDDDTPVAVKVLHSDYHHLHETFLERFQREARALGKLKHPGIVRLLDFGQDGEHHYLVTEYVVGQNLAQRLRDGPLPFGLAVDVVAQVCDVLAYAHDEGVVHRDIKPANILLSGDRVKVVDFGLAQITGWDSTLSSLTRTNLAMGTFNYLSPEQRESAKEVDGRSDIFSLGVVLYEALVGRLPLGAFSLPSRIKPALPRRVDRIVEQALAVDTEDRYPEAEAFGSDLRALVRPRRLGRVAAVAAAALLAIGLGGGTLWWVSTERDTGEHDATSAADQAVGQSKRLQSSVVLAKLIAEAQAAQPAPSALTWQPAIQASTPDDLGDEVKKGSKGYEAPTKRLPVKGGGIKGGRTKGDYDKGGGAKERPRRDRITKATYRRAIEAGMPLKGNPGRPPKWLIGKMPDVYALWSQRWKRYLKDSAPRPAPRRIPAPRGVPERQPSPPLK